MCALQVFRDMQRELVLMTKPKHKNVLMVHGMYALGSSVGVWWSGPPITARMRSAETQAHFLLALDLWDLSARSLLDDDRQTLKVAS